ncbi:hypothetical protein E1A91_D03G017100v1 [Gossypium mustelinum]|uniref:Uncharacterized protein n=1 Tax=Gossypium mustelinum TaxID=34275 RepID=A0A5D2VHV2_GOSMU|nr:hypothetical protein E1A91_D03G017100v1 [Gossypium mustelinum]
MMGCQSSQTKGGNAESTSQVKPDSQLEADLSSYEAACRQDSTLQHFDATLQEHTNSVIGTLAVSSGVQSISFNTLQEAVVEVILECQRDIWNNSELFSLVEEYFENSKKTLDFCTMLENCLKRAQNDQLIIQLAVKYFDEEVGLEVGVDEKKFVKTLEELRRFKAADKPFPKEFFVLLDLVRKQQESMLGKLLVRKKKLDKKLKSLKTWRRVSNVLFVATFVSVLIFSVVAAAVSAPPVVTALASELFLLKEVKEQMGLTTTMELFARITIYDMDDIRVLVTNLEIKIESLLKTADFALGEEDALKLAMDEIKKKLGEFMEIIEKLGQQADKCSRDIRMARAVVLHRMMTHSSTSTTGDMPLDL